MRDDKSTFIAELEVGASYASLMSATSLFFTGILISQYRSFNATIKVPLIYLIISTFSFIFAATIYSNAGNELTLNRTKAVEKYMIYAKNIVELLGLYLFILAVPLVIGSVTQDSFLRTSTIVVAIVGFTMYSRSKFSVLDKELSLRHKQYLSTVIVILALLLYYTQSRAVHHSLVLYSTIAVVLLLIILAATARFSVKSRQYKPIIVREFREGDAPKLAAIVLKNVGIMKNRPLHDTARLYTTPESVEDLAKEGQLFVAVHDSKVVGMACLKAGIITTIFTDPVSRRKGVGRALVERIESEVSQGGLGTIDAYATLHVQSFYSRLGYDGVGEAKNDDGLDVMLMRKDIYDNLT
jgi:GNAT superfamily N-acetyltransferase